MLLRHARGAVADSAGSFGRLATPNVIVGIFVSAPYFASSRIASTSSAYAARQNAVAPVNSTPMRPVL
jgi:hypothetical protein